MPSQVCELMTMSWACSYFVPLADVGMLHRVSCLQRCEKDLSSVVFDPEPFNAYPSNAIRNPESYHPES